MAENESFDAKCAYLSSYPEVSAFELYSSIFPLDTIEKLNDDSFRASNPIISFKKHDENGRAYFWNEILFADTFEKTINEIAGNEMALCSMMSYCGRRKLAKNAYKCHGFCIDLDGVRKQELEFFFGWVYELKNIPVPSFVANSGNGIHVYYVFERPVPMYPENIEALQNLKRGLTEWVWNRETSTYSVKDRQFQGIYQSFRMVGTKAKIGDRCVRCWKIGGTVTLEYLSLFVDNEYKWPACFPDYSSDLYTEEQKYQREKGDEPWFQDWYQRRIVNNDPIVGWKSHESLYYWWLRLIQQKGNAKDGNRYHCVSMLYVYAIKCRISKEQVDADARALIPDFNRLTLSKDNQFTEADVRAASKFYDSRFVKFSCQEIERRTGIHIVKQHRKSRPQVEHLKRARFSEKLMRKNHELMNDGRPSKQQIVEEWQASHPGGRKCDCIKDTQLSKPTVLKWWKNTPKQ